MKTMRRVALFLFRCVTLRSVSSALWVDAYENHNAGPSR